MPIYPKEKNEKINDRLIPANSDLSFLRAKSLPTGISSHKKVFL